MGKIKLFQEFIAWSVALAGASTVMLVLILVGGCNSTQKPQDATLQQAEDACFTGTMAAYQRISRDEKTNVVCK